MKNILIRISFPFLALSVCGLTMGQAVDPVEQAFRAVIKDSVKESAIQIMTQKSGTNGTAFPKEVLSKIDDLASKVSEAFTQCFEPTYKKFKPEEIKIFQQSVIEAKNIFAGKGLRKIHYRRWKELYGIAENTYGVEENTISCDGDLDSPSCKSLLSALQILTLSSTMSDCVESAQISAASGVPNVPSFSELKQAYSKKDYAFALKGIRLYAEQGHLLAQLMLAYSYWNGEGVPEDHQEGAFWGVKAAEQGDADAQYHVGKMFEDGDGVPKDDQQALSWFRKAADQGIAKAQYKLGERYATGNGVPKDQLQAMMWYQKAADQGYAFAMTSLGAIYENGWGVSKDYEKAIAWYKKAASQGDEWAPLILGSIYEAGDRGVPIDHQQAVSWYRMSAEKGDVIGQGNLAHMYRHGHGVPQDYQLALFWFRKAAEQGDSYAMFNIGDMYRKGDGVPQNFQEALSWHTKAADRGSRTAQTALGFMSKNGQGVPVDLVHAYKWFSLAATKGDKAAANEMKAAAEKMDSQQIEEAIKLVGEWQAKHP